jgi:hypothetical protein
MMEWLRMGTIILMFTIGKGSVGLK